MSATDGYFLYRAKEMAPGSVILDLGCGDARFVETMVRSGINAIGVDLPDARHSVELRAGKCPEFDLVGRVKYLDNPERIPLANESVDLVVSNTAFEHIPTLESTVRELARVLRPGGRVYTVFPLASCIIEQHANLPLAHKIRNDAARLHYVQLAKKIGIYRRSIAPKDISLYIGKHCYYRSDAEVTAIFRTYFDNVRRDTKTYVNLKAQSLMASGDGVKRSFGGILSKAAPALAPIIHIFHSAAYLLSRPKTKMH